jgi:hypothetical protein
MAISAARVTRLGMSGYMTKPYGSFAGKTPTVPPLAVVQRIRGFTRNIGRLMNP